MTTSLYWRPVNTDVNFLSDELKFALMNRYGLHIDHVFKDADIQYLNGLSDAGIKCADELIDAIKQHGEIRISEI